MPRNSRLSFFVFFSCLASLLATAQVPKDFRASVAVLQSSNTDGKLTEGRVLDAVWYAAAALNIPADKLPHIIVVHAALGAAQIANIPTSTCTNDRKSCGATLVEPTEDGEKLYYLWMIGSTSDEVLVRGVVQILQANAGLPESGAEEVSRRVLLHLRTVVRAGDFRG